MDEILFSGITRNGNTISKVFGYHIMGLENGEETHCIVNQTDEQKKTGEFTSHIVDPERIEIIRGPKKEFMLQQLLGFRLGSQGYSIIELVSCAGLTKKEWLEIKDEVDVTSLKESDINDIEEYVNDLKEL